MFGWSPCWDIGTAIEKVVEWNKCWLAEGDIRACMDGQIEEFSIRRA
jgi:CDP-glucose 4,6-dehydratase